MIVRAEGAELWGGCGGWAREGDQGRCWSSLGVKEQGVRRYSHEADEHWVVVVGGVRATLLT
jgi:hypothetical protein